MGIYDFLGLFTLVTVGAYFMAGLQSIFFGLLLESYRPAALNSRKSKVKYFRYATFLGFLSGIPLVPFSLGVEFLIVGALVGFLTAWILSFIEKDIQFSW